MKRFFLCLSGWLMALVGILVITANLVLPMVMCWFAYITESGATGVLDLIKDGINDFASYHFLAAGSITDIALCLWVTPILADSYAVGERNRTWVRILFAVVTMVFTITAMGGFQLPFKWTAIAVVLPLIFLIFSCMEKEVRE